MLDIMEHIPPKVVEKYVYIALHNIIYRKFKLGINYGWALWDA